MKEDSSDDDMDILNISDTKEEIKDQPRNSMFMPIENFPQPISKKGNRHKSLPLKAFKVSSPAESKILSSICDNIFEDEVINDNINLSMIKMKSNINLKNTFINEDEKNEKKVNFLQKLKLYLNQKKKKKKMRMMMIFPRSKESIKNHLFLIIY